MTDVTAICARCGHDQQQPLGKTWLIVLPLEGPSQNQVSNAGRFSKGPIRYRQIRDAAIVLLKHEAMRQRIPAATARRRVTLTRIIGKGGRLYDRGNWVGGAKPILDALVRAGLLVDDTEQWCDDLYRQEKDGGEMGIVRVEIQEMEP